MYRRQVGRGADAALGLAQARLVADVAHGAAQAAGAVRGLALIHISEPPSPY